MPKPSKTDIWMPFYIGDYLKDTGRLSTEAHGAYLLLMLDYWSHGAPPADDDGELSSITRLSPEAWRGLRGRLVGFFEVRGGKWFHKRIEAELEIARGKADRARENGKNGGRPKNPENPDKTQLVSDWFEMCEFFGNTCVRCGEAVKLQRDHVIPRSFGGSDEISNFQPLCAPCNTFKGQHDTDYRREVISRIPANLQEKWFKTQKEPSDNPEFNLGESSSQSQSHSPAKTASRTKRAAFAAPSLEEVRAYCLERGNSVDPEQFHAFYTTNGWVQGKGKPIKDWKACVITWEGRRSFGGSAGSRAPRPAKNRGEHVEVLRL